MAAIHHVAITVNEYEKYVALFESLGMTIQKTRGEAPHRQLWFNEGIQLNEVAEEERAGKIDHIALGTETVSDLLETAMSVGCSKIPEKERWFTLPDGIKVELMDLSK